MPFWLVRSNGSHEELLNVPVSASSVTAQRFFLAFTLLSLQSGKHSVQPGVVHVQDTLRSIEPEVSMTSIRYGMISRRSGSVCAAAGATGSRLELASNHNAIQTMRFVFSILIT